MPSQAKRAQRYVIFRFPGAISPNAQIDAPRPIMTSMP
jgi:hypothetical protein